MDALQAAIQPELGGQDWAKNRVEDRRETFEDQCCEEDLLRGVEIRFVPILVATKVQAHPRSRCKPRDDSGHDGVQVKPDPLIWLPMSTEIF